MQVVVGEFERWTELSPQSGALIYRDEMLSYAELNRQANQLAHWLRQQGLGIGQPVAVLVRPGFAISIAMLAILKAGGIYVPLDPDYPRARLEIILADVMPAMIVTTADLLASLPSLAIQLLVLDQAQALLETCPRTNPEAPISPDHTATIFYTSGTTGKPKGVMASHANLTQYLGSAREHYRFSPADVMPAVARFTFSISMFELMLPLTSGGAVMLLDREHVLDVPRMVQALQQVSFFHIGPSLLRGLVGYIRTHLDRISDFSHVRHASSGGDMIPPELLADLREIFSAAEIYVIYGCSEISCMGCTYRLPVNGAISKTYVGKPFDRVSLRLLDENGQPVPVGSIGEIVFGGQGVVKGYLNRPELTAEKFISIDGDRVYATGDVGRFAEDGNLEMLGRRDFQVQLRGMRVELAEVEFTLRRAPGVNDAVVMAKETAAGEKVLVAYCVFSPDAEDDIALVKRYAGEQLPDYMVPSRYVVLDALPLNHNMKVDRFALPHPDELRTRGAADDPPATDTERKLAAIWSKLLRLDEIQRTDNFFDLGGYSLLGVECVREAEAEFSVTIDGMDLLRENLAILSAMIDQGLGRRPAAIHLPQAPFQVDTFYFGLHERLYGVYRAAQQAQPKPAILICPAFGSEWIRAHFVMRKVTQRLVDLGYPVMRFDFFGTGDSLGEQVAADLADWQADIGAAADELRRRSGSQEIVGIGVRWGGSLLRKYGAAHGIDRQILWDPVLSGLYHLNALRASQIKLRRYMRAMFPIFHRSAALAGEQLLGFHYSQAAIAGMQSFAIADQLTSDTHIVDSLNYSDISAQWRELERQQRLGSYTLMDTPTDWWRAAGLETLWPDRGISQVIVATVMASCGKLPCSSANRIRSPAY